MLPILFSSLSDLDNKAFISLESNGLTLQHEWGTPLQVSTTTVSNPILSNPPTYAAFNNYGGTMIVNYSLAQAQGNIEQQQNTSFNLLSSAQKEFEKLPDSPAKWKIMKEISKAIAECIGAGFGAYSKTSQP